MAEKFIDIKMFGDKQLQKDLKRVEIKEQKKVVRKAMRVGAKPVLQSARQTVPVRRGKLRKSLKLRSASGRGKLGVAIRTGDRAELDIPSTDKGYYPAVIEYGSRTVPAKSYLRAPFDTLKDVALANTAEAMAVGITKALKK